MKKFITKDSEIISHDIITDCDCFAHLLRITKYSDEDELSLMHYSCVPEEAVDTKNLCWDVILNKKKAVELAESILKMYEDSEPEPDTTALID